MEIFSICPLSFYIPMLLYFCRMKVKCKQTTSQGFDLKEVTDVLSNDFDYNVGGWGIELDSEYLVMGMAVFKDTNCLYYLIDVQGKPFWYPYLLFNVSDNSLPQNWFLKVIHKKEDSDFFLLWGFYELCNEQDYCDKLMDRDEPALMTYFKRKIELEKELSGKD